MKYLYICDDSLLSCYLIYFFFLFFFFFCVNGISTILLQTCRKTNYYNKSTVYNKNGFQRSAPNNINDLKKWSLKLLRTLVARTRLQVNEDNVGFLELNVEWDLTVQPHQLRTSALYHSTTSYQPREGYHPHLRIIVTHQLNFLMEIDQL